jgi:hypothetical protein
MWFSSAASGAYGARLLQVVSSGYSRDLEREADSEGLARVAAAGYDVASGVTMLERLRDWAAEEQVQERAAFHASHPRLEERIESCRAAVKERGAGGGVRNDEAYADRTAAILLVNARLDLAAGRYGGARGDVERYLALRSRDPRARTPRRRPAPAGSPGSSRPRSRPTAAPSRSSPRRPTPGEASASSCSARHATRRAPRSRGT